jgi:hypothetical protein
LIILKIILSKVMVKVIGKTIPLQAWKVPEDSRRMRLLDFKTMGQEGGKVVNPTQRPSLPQEILISVGA